MKKNVFTRLLSLFLVMLFLGAALNATAAPTSSSTSKTDSKGLNLKKVTPADRKAAADKLQKMLVDAGLTALLPPKDFGKFVDPDTGYLVPDYFGSPNWAYSPILEKFVDRLPGLGSTNANDLGQYIPVAIPDTKTYPANPAITGSKDSDYYEIAVVEYMEWMHSDLPKEGTKNRGYVQIWTDKLVNAGTGVPLFEADGTTPIYYPGTTNQVMVVDKPHYLGPLIDSNSDKPVRIKFYNFLPIGVKGDLYIPTDTTVMGSGMGPTGEQYTQNRANVHLHGNNTVWISDGSPHQWITPANEVTPYPQGTSVVGVPDMDDPVNPKDTARDGITTLYYTNSQSARLMFYHDHSFGITRLNVYAGEAAPYIIRDKVEKDLLSTAVTEVNPTGKVILPTDEIPLVIQDRTFVDKTTVFETDPTWAWGSIPAKPATFNPDGSIATQYVPATAVTGDLWYPHVYSPAQNPYNLDGANPFGRWMYGPWFYPPTENIAHKPVPNPYYDVAIDPNHPDYRPPMMPGTPNPSAPGESFMDTPLVNGTAYPYLEVDPKAYRFRVLNAANDRFFNLSLFFADDVNFVPGEAGYLKEVAMVDAIPGDLPGHIDQRIPDMTRKGPDWIQIGTEGGFLPSPAIIPAQYTTWNLAGTAFNFGVVDQHSLLLGTAERADVIVDFSQYAGETLILYNDAPAPFPANDTRYDYFLGNENQQSTGGAPDTLAGFGPNTRTIMQIKVSGTKGANGTAYDDQLLKDVFKKGAIPATNSTPTNSGVFATGQDTIIIPQSHYNDAYGVSLPADAASAYVQLDENDKTFKPINRDGVIQAPVTLPLEPKAMHDEMSGVFDEYGRMSGFLGLTSPKANATQAPFLAYGYSSPPVELFKGIEEDLDMVAIGDPDKDGTQIWQITHNGVDTHTIHTHLFSAQLINRVAWDGAMMAPDENELGWKETFRINPLEQTVIAMRPKVPAPSEIPFDVPNSVRLIDPTMPVGALLPAPPPESWFNPLGDILAQVINHEVNFGWEYVYHCHILSHEEMDMMHSMAVSTKVKAPTNLDYTSSGSGAKKTVNLTWEDNSPNETDFRVQRSLTPTGPWTTLATLAPNTTTYSNLIGNTTRTYFYRVIATNTVGDTETVGFPTLSSDAVTEPYLIVGPVLTTPPAAPTSLGFTVQPGPQVLLSWTDNAINETGFFLERKVGPAASIEPYTLLATVPAKTNTGLVSYLDANVLPGTQYTYRVAAVNSAGTSAYAVSPLVTLDAFPIAPTSLNATASIASKRNAKVTLTWSDNSGDETGFTVEWCTNPSFTGPNFVSVLVKANSTTYTTGNLLRNTPYYFRIRANNGAGSSVWVNANPFPVTTP